MTTAASLDYIKEGYAYRDGRVQELYSPDDPVGARAAVFRKCLSYDFGPLTVRACLDISGPALSVEVTLLGVTLANCDLSLQHQNCTIGGSIDGFKAQLDLVLSDRPLQLAIDGQLCAPFAGCETLHTVVPF